MDPLQIALMDPVKHPRPALTSECTPDRASVQSVPPPADFRSLLAVGGKGSLAQPTGDGGLVIHMGILPLAQVLARRYLYAAQIRDRSGVFGRIDR